MSEVEENEVEEKVEQVEEQVEPEQTEEQPPQPNPLFKTLFEIEDGQEGKKEEEVEEDVSIPMTLNEAMDDISEEPKDEEPEEVEPEEEEEVKAEEPQKAEPKKKKLRKVIDPEVPEASKPEMHFDQPEEDKYKEFKQTLLPEEKEVFELAVYASNNMDEFEGYDEKFKDFFTRSKAFLDKRIDDDPNYDPREDDSYNVFLEKNRPKFTASDAKKIEKKMWLEEAKADIRKELEPETAELKQKLKIAEKKPQVEQAKSNFRSMAQKVVIPKEYQETFESGGQEAISKFAQENPLEYEIMEKASKNLLTYGDTLTDIFMEATPLDQSDPIHKDLVDWVNNEQDNFIKGGQTEQDGRVFMRRERYFSLPENQRSQYYTWSDDDLLKILALRTQEQVHQAIAKQREVLEKSGYVRQEASAQVKKPKKPAKVAQKPLVVDTKPRQGDNLNRTTKKKANNAMLNVLGF
ncbi:MAG: hypothetical protein CMC82_05980 [Flavobacteriaceae bacterium]|nr:hypothetical protein [Flavobacteriaceae bacterium]